jgi:nucleoside-diphosphate-sugar epimerase
MTIGITGSTGFVGRALVQRLLGEGKRIKLLARTPEIAHRQFPQAEITEGGLDAPESQLQSFVQGVEVLFHCAAEINVPERMFSTNVVGTERLAAVASGKIRHWVQLSSVDIFGTQPMGIVSESTLKGDLNLYEETKLDAEKVLVAAASRGNYSYSILRPAKIYGPGMQNPLLFKLFNLVQNGFFFYIGRPGASANYVHIQEVVDALILLSKKTESQNCDYNLSDYCTMEELVGYIAGALGRSAPNWRVPETAAHALARLTQWVPHNLLTVQRVNAMVKRARYSSTKIEQELGFRHRIPLSRGIPELVEIWRSGLD